MDEADGSRPRRESPLLWALYFLAYVSVLVRMLLRPPSEGTTGTLAYGLMAIFLALAVAQAILRQRSLWWTRALLVLQSGVVFALLQTKPDADYYAMLYIALSIVASRDLPGRQSIAWLAAFCVLPSLGLLLAYGVEEGASYMPAYIAGCLIIGLYGRASRKAEEARERSEGLAAELGDANRRLRAYAGQAEEAAAAQERAGLARDLHDAATQTVFSMNLTAEAARMSLAEDPSRVPALLDRLQELARDALAEMRTLVRELRPTTIAETGLVKSLEHHAGLRERRDGLRVSLAVDGEEQGSAEVREALFRTAREALNNVVKHAGVKEADVSLRFTGHEASIEVRDAGKGFDPAVERGSESFGLLALRERLEELGGALSVEAAPGKGVAVIARVPIRREGS
jgi:signal transduction histidine kinase